MTTRPIHTTKLLGYAEQAWFKKHPPSSALRRKIGATFRNAVEEKRRLKHSDVKKFLWLGTQREIAEEHVRASAESAKLREMRAVVVRLTKMLHLHTELHRKSMGRTMFDLAQEASEAMAGAIEGEPSP